MSRLRQHPEISASVSITLTEEEMRALEALFGYSIDAFLKIFYKNMGEHYLKPHEAGLRSLNEVVNRDLPSILHRIDSARQAFVLDNPVIRSKEDHEALVQRIRESVKKETKEASI